MLRLLSLALATVILAAPVWGRHSADFNGDGKIDFTDFIMFAGSHGSVKGDETYDFRFDINENGRVDFDDFALFAAEFGVDPHSEKTSEPIKADHLEELAKAYRESGDYKHAIEKYEQFLEAAETSLQKARGLKEIGEIYFVTGDLNKANEHYVKAIKDYKETEDGYIKHQLLWCGIGLSQIQLFKGNENDATLYLEVAKLFLPNSDN